MSGRSSHTSDGRRAKFWTTQTIHLSVRRRPDAPVKSPRHRWPLDRHTTDRRPATEGMLELAGTRGILSIRTKVQKVSNVIAHRAVFSPTSTRRPMPRNRTRRPAHA